MKGTLWLIPNVLDDGDPEKILTAHALEKVRTLRFFIVENEKSARRFLVRIGMKEFLESIEWAILDEHTRSRDLPDIIKPILEGQDAGVLSESGCPGIADPGSDIVRMAHQAGIRVKPLVGPSSVVLSLMASGLGGQRFAFLGYLPAKPNDRVKKIREIEQRSKSAGETQIFIEAPYRNIQLFQDLVRNLHPETWLSLSVELTSEEESIKTMKVWEWAGKQPDIHKKRVVFLVSAN